MSRMLSWAMTGALLLGSGCSHELNDTWLELSQTQSAITTKLLDFERTHMALMKGSIEKTFQLYEQEIVFRENVQFLDPRTVVIDGVERIMVTGPDGQPAAVSRADLEKFVGDAMAARTLLAAKKAEWNHVFAEWERLLADVGTSNQLTLRTAEDIHAALASAQRVLEDVTKVVASLTAVTAGYFLAG